jgi:Protein of unknown function (DUF2934)
MLSMMAKKSTSTSRRQPQIEKDAAAERKPARWQGVARKRQPRTGPKPVNGIATDDIRMRAYFLSLERNGATSDPVADWLRAERELAATSLPEQAPSARPRRRMSTAAIDRD